MLKHRHQEYLAVSLAQCIHPKLIIHKVIVEMVHVHQSIFLVLCIHLLHLQLYYAANH